MSMLKKYKKISSLAVLLIGIVGLASVQTSNVSALTDPEKRLCENTWQGTRINDRNEDSFKDSKCFKSDYCKIDTSRQIEDDGTQTIIKRADCESRTTSLTDVSGTGTASPSNCADIETTIVDCSSKGGNPIIGLLLQIVNFLAVGVGIAVVGGIIWGGLVYASSNGDASKVKQAKAIIVNSVIGLILFFFMFALINYLVPGGLFN